MLQESNIIQYKLFLWEILIWVLTIIFLPLHLVMLGGQKITDFYDKYFHTPLGRILNDKKWELNKKLFEAKEKERNNR